MMIEGNTSELKGFGDFERRTVMPGRNSHEFTAIDRFEKRLNKRKVTALLFNKVDENLRIERDGAGFKVIGQSHWRRSLFTCFPASSFFQTSFAQPLEFQDGERGGIFRC